ncbi:hypothetical protein FB45DRAFT_868499 [Roridomyces roridus]|uniref:Uncharacterized protein n=1 Tax=Roridomyces roridus TaxID=1738132 RepID=A0AAD7BQ04_9AGAR|nr:hypothetical protein FB45DRAFT_868499 [Roridomyces roridus]
MPPEQNPQPNLAVIVEAQALKVDSNDAPLQTLWISFLDAGCAAQTPAAAARSVEGVGIREARFQPHTAEWILGEYSELLPAILADILLMKTQLQCSSEAL